METWQAPGGLHIPIAIDGDSLVEDEAKSLLFGRHFKPDQRPQASFFGYGYTGGLSSERQISGFRSLVFLLHQHRTSNPSVDLEHRSGVS
jgi:hypothetical protein